MEQLSDIKLLAFDADDTLWDCQCFFDEVSERYCDLLAHYGEHGEIGDALFNVEMGNMEELGYGSKAFVISLVENALRVSNYRISARETEEIIALGRSLLRMTAQPLPHVAETLREIRGKGRYTMVVFTKGDQLEQEQKFLRSGLADMFDDLIIVSDKTPQAYERLCKLFGAKPAETVMIGNSLKSDIRPAIQAGCHAIHIPHAITWQHEHAEPIEHERLTAISRFDELCRLL